MLRIVGLKLWGIINWSPPIWLRRSNIPLCSLSMSLGIEKRLNSNVFSNSNSSHSAEHTRARATVWYYYYKLLSRLCPSIWVKWCPLVVQPVFQSWVIWQWLFLMVETSSLDDIQFDFQLMCSQCTFFNDTVCLVTYFVETFVEVNRW